ncbi:MAG: beta-hydroxyacyl-ACP dehydratase [Muribaculaceae bacterium]|nr:beta-hydroxyacyl-ACP dehydratase [Muribaculaceae bacterium]
MTLQGDIYEILQNSCDGSSHEFVIQLKSESPIYQGHFPGNPITPGVVIIATARELVETCTGQKLRLAGAPSVKYTSVMAPTSSPTIRYSITTIPEGNIVKAKVTVTGENITFARMLLKWINI